MIALGMLILSTAYALADCKQVATGANNAPIYQCDAPAPPAPPAPPTKCWHFNGALLCTGDITKAPASNCSFKSGKYVCW
jgi:hypothetical protein